MKFFAIIAFAIALTACGSSKAKTEQAEKSESVTMYSPVAEFDSERAYSYIKTQVEFGPRVPGTEGHRKCAEYIESQFRKFGADSIIVQEGTMTAFNGDVLPVKNIMAMYYPNARRRILLVAHYDTRPWADNETDENKRKQPIPGANDGASGVGVLLEIARKLNALSPKVGVDILMVDAEDYGDGESAGNTEDTWCLGTQMWGREMPYGADIVRPSYGIVLDMVGGEDAVFYREHTSELAARGVNDRIWGMAASSPYASKFINRVAGYIVDDHLYVNRVGIPCVDIVECNNAITGAFPPTWHTHSDDLQHIDKSTLKAVGQVVLDVIYSEDEE